ncbi:MAG: AraC family transcriptional regulator [Spirochaetia bacterium]|nr:AraC family transcriptional regulator [Spirochaetia bacterium]MCF7941334.1 AraC family transcriptional regulator [Spirochaetia bacterium]
MERFSLQSIVPGYISELGYISQTASTPLGFHINRGYEFVYVYSGHFRFELSDSSLLQVPGRKFSITSPDTEHRGYLNYLNRGALFFVVFDPGCREFRRELRLSPGSVREIRRVLQESSDRVFTPSGLFCSQMDILRTLSCELDPAIQSDRAHLLHSLSSTLMLLFRELSDPPEGAPDEVIYPLQQYIAEHLSEPLSIEVLIKVSGYSRSRLYSLFDLHAGQSPNDYIQSTRCIQAAGLLTQSDRSVTQIALECGFSSSQYFARVFARYTGMSPTSYRNGGYLSRQLRFPGENRQ